LQPLHLIANLAPLPRRGLPPQQVPTSFGSERAIFGATVAVRYALGKRMAWSKPPARMGHHAVRISGPDAETAIVFSKWADRLPSRVRTVQPSSST